MTFTALSKVVFQTFRRVAVHVNFFRELNSYTESFGLENIKPLFQPSSTCLIQLLI